MDEVIVFVNVGWMIRYRGPKNDPTLGGHGWLKAHDYGHEAWNYLPYKGRVFGYVPRSAQIRLARLGGTSRDERIDGVTVVWIARSPRDKHTYVVGWYRNATIHKRNDHLRVRRSNELTVEYQIEAPEADSHLLELEQRVLRVPTAKSIGNLGQSPVWYGNPSFLREVRNYLRAGGRVQRAPDGSGAPKQSDPLLRRKIELAAVNHAIAFYSSEDGGGYQVRTVEKDRVGWDLEATSGDVTLLIEVKGLSSDELCVELTPNEYDKMLSAEHRSSYVVYVVTQAMAAHRRSHVFYYNAEASSGNKQIWMASDGRVLNIDPRTAARLTVQ